MNKKTISINQLSKWGLLRQIKFEEIIDLNLKSIPEPNEAEIKEKIQEWCKINQIQSEKHLKEWKNRNGFNEEPWKEFISRKWKWTKWCSKKFEDKLSNYYLERKSMLDKVNYSLIRVTSKNLADELYLRIKEEESSFETIAREYSEGPEKMTSGNIGPVPLGNAHPSLAKILEVSKKGQIWPPKKLESWWVIIKLNYLRSIPLDDKLSTLLSNELGKEFIEKLVDNDLKKNSVNFL
ncbi:hypothetical protein HA149_06290 [Prochlorococcus marinus XMU1406]|uniref:peptidylprolyl isomerase n=1 Tax=Prochlorococcus marinus TaxID=1219 RepID=UPI001ADA660F|nr:peptidylprolyl isomerase [Prochlorococcus marinus]MBO8206670.1 hypothetical protein [Prochlorococcus marinus XMU1406]MCR8544276.1 peptidylprolyl isomerase [Prochlorococcus marinus XMU1427]